MNTGDLWWSCSFIGQTHYVHVFGFALISSNELLRTKKVWKTWLQMSFSIKAFFSLLFCFQLICRKHEQKWLLAFEPTTKRKVLLMEHCPFYYIICYNFFFLPHFFPSYFLSIDDDHSVNFCCLCSMLKWLEPITVCCFIRNCLDDFRLIFTLSLVSDFIFTSQLTTNLVVFHAMTDEVFSDRISCKQNYER